jgi:hypothetical protein
MDRIDKILLTISISCFLIVIFSFVLCEWVTAGIIALICLGWMIKRNRKRDRINESRDGQFNDASKR